MKKMIFVAGMLTAGFMSANNNINVCDNEIKEVFQSITTVKENSSVEKVQSMRQICVVFHATCTSAYTCFEGNSIEDVYDDAVEWAGNIQANYCMINSPFEP